MKDYMEDRIEAMAHDKSQEYFVDLHNRLQLADQYATRAGGGIVSRQIIAMFMVQMDSEGLK